MQKEEMTALMFAVKVGSFDVVKLLVEKSANLLAMNSVRKPLCTYSKLIKHSLILQRAETVLQMVKNSNCSKEIREYLLEKYKGRINIV